MAADFKSHVLLRDEKGFLGLPFKRLLLAGVVGGMTYALSRFTLPNWAIPIGILVGLFVLVMTGTRGGLPLWQRLVYRLRGSLLLIVAHHPHGILHQLSSVLELPVELVTRDGTQIFSASHNSQQLDMREWVTFARAGEADLNDGLTFVDRALGRDA